MKSNFKITGVEKVIANINKELEKMKTFSLAGMIDAAIDIQRDMEAGPTKIPLDLGNLRASFFITTSMGTVPEGKAPNFKGDDSGQLIADHQSVLSTMKTKAVSAGVPMVVLGFSANYAIYVHEAYGDNIEWSRPGSGPGFFKNALERNEKQILKKIRDSTIIK